MTRAEQERMVERYLGGEMNSADEEEFFIQVAIDSDLRQTLKAYRIVESAIRKHRDTAASRHSETRDRLISMLGTQPGKEPVGRSRPSPIPRTGMADPQNQRRVALAVFGTALLRWRFAMVAAIALIIGIYGIAPLIHDQPEAAPAPQRLADVRSSARPAAPAPTVAEAAPSVAKREVAPPIVIPEASAVTGRRVAEETAPPSESRPRLSRKSLIVKEAPAQPRSEVRKETAPRVTEKNLTVKEAPAQPVTKVDTPTVRKVRKRPIISVTDSTIKVRVRIDLPKQ
jgi:hypothetical protein